MTTHRAAWMTRISVIGALVAGSLALFAGPASAADFSIEPNPESLSLRVGGGKATTTVTVSGNGSGDLRFRLSGVNDYGAGFADAVPGCSVGANTITCSNIVLSGSKSFDITVGAPAQSDLDAGDTAKGKIEVMFKESGVLGGGAGRDIGVTLVGAAQGGVIGVAGTVTDANSAPVADAAVRVNDAAGKVKGATTDEEGRFIVDAQGDPFQPGTITIQISKTGYTPKSVTRTGVAGQPITGLDVKLAISGTPTPTPSASASESPAAEPSAAASSAPAAKTRDSGGIGALGWILILLGLLLVGGGGFAIYFLLRKNKDDEPGPVRPAPAVYGGNRIPADDSPTMMHAGPLVTDDPYGYSPQRDPRYADHTQPYGGHGYGHQRTDQYGAPADPYAAVDSFAAAPPTQQYRPPAEPYNAAPTQQYNPRPAVDPYAEPTQPYRPEPPAQPRQPDRRPLDWLDD